MLRLLFSFFLVFTTFTHQSNAQSTPKDSGVSASSQQKRLQNEKDRARFKKSALEEIRKLQIDFINQDYDSRQNHDKEILNLKLKLISAKESEKKTISDEIELKEKNFQTALKEKTDQFYQKTLRNKFSAMDEKLKVMFDEEKVAPKKGAAK